MGTKRALLRALPACTLGLGLLLGCGPSVDCGALCQRTLACEVTFQAPDDPNDQLVDSGERTELESCALGCQASPLVTADTGRCIDDLDTRDPGVCQQQVLDCLAVDE